MWFDDLQVTENVSTTICVGIPLSLSLTLRQPIQSPDGWKFVYKNLSGVKVVERR